MQLRAFLDDQYIETAKIPKIGDGRKTILRGYGIETALDVVEKQGIDIPGFGPTLRSALQSWVRGVSRQFRFDPKKDVPEGERRSRVAEYRRKQLQIEGQIRKGASDLRGLSGAAGRRADELATDIASLQARAARARADWLAIEA